MGKECKLGRSKGSKWLNRFTMGKTWIPHTAVRIQAQSHPLEYLKLEEIVFNLGDLSHPNSQRVLME